MRTRRLGSNGPDISVIGYGAWEIGGDAYGPNPDERELVSAIHAALDAGVNWVDTAEVYGKGNSESIVGRALSGRPDVLVATKVAPAPVGSGFRPEEVRRAVRGSLQRLGRDHIDLYQLHWPAGDNVCPVEETWSTMASLVDEGLVRHVGVSNFDRELIERCLGVRHVDSLQPQLSMLHRKNEELAAWSGSRGVGVVVYGPLAYGLLTGAVGADTKFEESDWRSGKDPNHSYYKDLFAPDRLPRNLGMVDALRPVAQRLDVSLGQLALAWVAQRPGVTSAIAGSRSRAHNQENAAAGDIALGDADVAEVESILDAVG
ncbi:MAG TPA: aldo/keto reductase [Actinomycetota bacterium]|nr:aldo/keto reductase [Actinomycetota bacterium]